MITLADLSAISQMVSSAAVVGSLMFVGVQLRQNTKATRAASHHAIIESLNQINLLWARNREVVSVLLAGMEDREALSAEQRWQFDSILRAYLHVCETMYTQAALGAVNISILTAEEAGIKFVFASAGVQAWWAENPFGFTSEFRQYVNKVVGP